MLAIAAATAPRTAPPETGAATARTQHQRCEHHDDDHAPRRPEGTSRRGNALVSAMMTALDGLLPDAATVPTRSEALKDSATAFAHELFDALRSGGDAGNGRGFAWGRREHHHRHGGGYDSLAQRLDRLAAQVDAPTAALTGTTTISASLSSASFSASVHVNGDGDAASASLSASVTTLQIDITQQTSTAAPESPLQAAFRKLFDALQPATAPDTAATAAAASSSSLSDFLRQLAGALRNGSGIDDHATTPATGGLLSLAA
jgi:hypothetical protein